MRGSLGEKIGEGVFSDVHAWAPGQVVKLFRQEVSPRFIWHEARMTRAVFAAGAPVPEVLDVVRVAGRLGMVLSRLDGPTLLQLARDGAMSRAEAGAILAALYRAVHATPPPRDVIRLGAWMEDALRNDAGRFVPPSIASAIRALIARLWPGNEHGLCHGDLHPGNVIMTDDGPRIVDWSMTMRGPAALDLAFGHIMLREIAPDPVDDPERPRAVDAAMQEAYARLAGVTPAALMAAIDLWLPVVRCFVLVFGPPSPLRERMIERIEAALGAQT